MRTVHRPWRRRAPHVSLSGLLNLGCSDTESFCPLPWSRKLFFVNYLVNVLLSLSLTGQMQTQALSGFCFVLFCFCFQRVIRFKVLLQGSKKIAHISQVIQTHRELQSSVYWSKGINITIHKASHVHRYTMGSIKYMPCYFSVPNPPSLPQCTMHKAFQDGQSQNFKARRSLIDYLLRTCPSNLSFWASTSSSIKWGLKYNTPSQWLQRLPMHSVNIDLPICVEETEIQEGQGMCPS